VILDSQGTNVTPLVTQQVAQVTNVVPASRHLNLFHV
jgi:hypothetical protein